MKYVDIVGWINVRRNVPVRTASAPTISELDDSFYRYNTANIGYFMFLINLSILKLIINRVLIAFYINIAFDYFSITTFTTTA